MTSSCGKVHVMRRTGEPVAAFERRTAENMPRFAFRCYKAQSSGSEGEGERTKPLSGFSG